MAVISDIRRYVYGTRDGAWLILAGPCDMEPPARVGALSYLGEPLTLIRLVRARRCHSQLELAALLDVGQQSASRYLRGGEPNLPATGWSALARECS